MLTPSRCAETAGKGYDCPAVKDRPVPLVWVVWVDSDTVLDGSTPYCPSFHAATRATEASAAVLAPADV